MGLATHAAVPSSFSPNGRWMRSCSELSGGGGATPKPSARDAMPVGESGRDAAHDEPPLTPNEALSDASSDGAALSASGGGDGLLLRGVSARDDADEAGEVGERGRLSPTPAPSVALGGEDRAALPEALRLLLPTTPERSEGGRSSEWRGDDRPDGVHEPPPPPPPLPSPVSRERPILSREGLRDDFLR